MKFFQFFPTVNYSFQSDTSTFGVDITNISAHVAIVERLKQHITAFYDYIVEDGERPDSVATKLYGGPEYTWIVLVMNNIMSHYDWPLTNTEFDNYIISKYGDVTTAKSQFIYKTTAGYLVDSITYNLLPAAERAVPVSLYDHEMTQNEAKRRIRAVPVEFVGPLVLELKRAFI